MKKLKTSNWILIALFLVSFIGCILEFQRRYLFLYFFIPFVLCAFFLIEKKIRNGKMIIPCFEQLSIPSMNGNVDGWLYKQSNEKAPLIIFFNGAGECSAETVRKFYEEGILSEYFPNYNFMCTDFPSYGFSEGYISEASMKKLALDTYDAAVKLDCVDSSSIAVMGYSIGTGPAAYLAAHRDLASLTLLAPYDEFWDQFVRNVKAEESRRSLTKTTSKFKWGFYRLLWSYNIDPYDYAKSVDEPTLIISSMEDITIPHEASMRVAYRLKDCEVVTLSGIKHEHLLCDTTYKAMQQFLYQ